MDTILEAIRDGLQHLQSIAVASGDLNAMPHKYRLHPPLSVEQVRQFEIEHQVVLPEDYRAFLIQLGNGGAGPGYGLEMLGYTSGVAWNESPGLVGDLSKPFPYAEAWNSEPIDGTRTVDEQFKQQDDYWNSRHVNGAIPVCDHGCNLRECLILTGPERGNMWFDDRADWRGLYPNQKPDRVRLTFLEWYQSWIKDCLLKAR